MMRLLFVPVTLAILSGVASAQIERVREAMAQVDVIDEALHQAMELFRSKLPEEEKRRKLEQLKIRQDFRLLVSGVAVGPQEIVTRALHPRAQLRVMVTFQNGKRARAEVVGNDPRSNVALIRTRLQAPRYLEPAQSPVVLKQQTFLIGYWGERPLDADCIVTRLSIGATCEDIYSRKEPKPRYAIGSVFVVASPGRRLNPGAACVDREGRLVGLLLGCAPAEAVPQPAGGPLAGMGRSFVLPSRRLVKVVRDLRQYGKVIRSEFGMRVAPVSAALRAQLVKVPQGAGTVTQVEAKGPAHAAGLRANDILLSVNGRSTEDVFLLRETLSDCKPGTKAKLKILRAGKETEVVVVPREAE
ncbi:MAG: S1C family serine protease [Planctomycetota bacterium]|jgi:serine protease Do